MATVCSGTMALMDAGVQLKKPVSGIAMGLISDGDSGKYAVLSDILGDEDHLGDMDFKVTGTADGITACQMDIKVKGLSYEILVKALKQAQAGRLHILEKLTDTIAAPNADVKAHAPKMVTTVIPNEFIGALIGPGGKSNPRTSERNRHDHRYQRRPRYGRRYRRDFGNEPRWYRCRIGENRISDVQA